MPRKEWARSSWEILAGLVWLGIGRGIFHCGFLHVFLSVFFPGFTWMCLGWEFTTWSQHCLLRITNGDWFWLQRTDWCTGWLGCRLADLVNWRRTIYVCKRLFCQWHHIYNFTRTWRWNILFVTGGAERDGAKHKIRGQQHKLVFWPGDHKPVRRAKGEFWAPAAGTVWLQAVAKTRKSFCWAQRGNVFVLLCFSFWLIVKNKQTKKTTLWHSTTGEVPG